MNPTMGSVAAGAGRITFSSRLLGTTSTRTSGADTAKLFCLGGRSRPKLAAFFQKDPLLGPGSKVIRIKPEPASASFEVLQE